MKNTQFVSMAQMFQLAGYDHTEMPQGTQIDISDMGIKVKSYKDGEVVYAPVLSIVRKSDSRVYQLKLVGGDVLLEATKDHKIYDPVRNEYVSIGSLQSVFALTETGDILDCIVVPTYTISPILDIEVEQTGCYFSNGILSHNSGGNALKYYASVRLDVRRTGSNKTAGEITSNTIVVKVKKNKTAPPFQEASLEILFGTGIDAYSEAIDLAIEYGLMQKSGAWFKLIDPGTGEIFNQQQGKPNMRQWLVENPEVYTNLRNTIVGAMRPLT